MGTFTMKLVLLACLVAWCLASHVSSAYADKARCTSVPSMECNDVDKPQVEHKTETKCKTVYNKDCKLEEEEQCYAVPKMDCNMVQKTKSKTVYDTVCNTVYDKKCTTVNEKQCETVMNKQCT